MALSSDVLLIQSWWVSGQGPDASEQTQRLSETWPPHTGAGACACAAGQVSVHVLTDTTLAAQGA